MNTNDIQSREYRQQQRPHLAFLVGLHTPLAWYWQSGYWTDSEIEEMQARERGKGYLKRTEFADTFFPRLRVKS